MSMSAEDESHYKATGMVLYLRTWQGIVLATRAMGIWFALALAAATFLRHAFVPGFDTLLVALTYAGVVLFGYWWIRSLDDETERIKEILATWIEPVPSDSGEWRDPMAGSRLRIIPGTTLPESSWLRAGGELILVVVIAFFAAIVILGALGQVLFDPNASTIAMVFIVLGIAWSVEHGLRAVGRRKWTTYQERTAAGYRAEE